MKEILVPYDSPTSLFRVYQPNECDKDGYPFIWDEISKQRRLENNNDCIECAKAYLETKDKLTVHHFNEVKEDCRRDNLEVMCWPCHLMWHSPSHGLRELKCPHCGLWCKSWFYLERHIRGKHANKILKAGQSTKNRPHRTNDGAEGEALDGLSAGGPR